MRDFNFTFLTGTVISPPSFIPLANGKKALIFTLQNKEHYKLADGRAASHSNNITVEVLGKNADKYSSELKIGTRCNVVGYLRVDELKGQEKMRVRAFRIEDLSGDE
jgi:single-stranded DNA-binding protein